jgi:hypothetical protein
LKTKSVYPPRNRFVKKALRIIEIQTVGDRSHFYLSLGQFILLARECKTIASQFADITQLPLCSRLSAASDLLWSVTQSSQNTRPIAGVLNPHKTA